MFCPIGGTDPYFGYVISLLHFRDLSLGSYSGSPPVATGAGPIDVIPGRVWTMIGRENQVASCIGLRFQTGEYSTPGEALIEGATDGAFSTTGDLTIEFLHNGNSFGIYSSITPAVLVSSMASNAPVSLGEWQIVNGLSSGTRQVSMTIVGAGGTFSVGSAVAGGTIPFNSDVAYAFTRQAGTWRCFVNGTLRGTVAAGDATALLTPITLASRQDGAYIIPNDYGVGAYGEWRWTAGIARYTTNYTPATALFPDHG